MEEGDIKKNARKEKKRKKTEEATVLP